MLRSDKAESPWTPDTGGGEGSSCNPMMNEGHHCDAEVPEVKEGHI